MVLEEKQAYLEQHMTAIAMYNEEFISDPNLHLDLFTFQGNKELIRVGKEVYSEKGKLAMEDIIVRLQPFGLDNHYIQLSDLSFEKSRYEDYLDQLQTAYAVRQARNLLDEVSNEKISLDEYQAEVNKITNSFSTGTATKWSADQIVAELQKNDERLIFCKNDFYSKTVKPVKKSVNVIAARTGIGKSAYALNLVNDLAERYMCLYFNLEMTEKEIYQRLMAIDTGISMNQFANCNAGTMNALKQSANRFEKKLKIKIYNGAKSIASIKKIVARESRKEHCVVFIDHIGYITNKKLTNTRERVQQTMIDLNLLTKDYECTVFAISQLNRDVDERPKLENLKDSGEVEQTAHSVVLLHNLEKDLREPKPEYEIICAKNRGLKGYQVVRFEKATQRFIERRGS
jgi:replicative DNA helicase